MLNEVETARLLRELRRESERGADGNVCGWEGEGDRERRPGAARVGMFARDGAEGDVKPRREERFGAVNCDCWCTAVFTWPFKLGYRGFVPVRSRKEWVEGACDKVRPSEGEALEASKRTRFEGEAGNGKDEG